MKINDYIEITNEDNMKLMARYPDNYFDLAIVDPPYGININESIGRRKGQKHSGHKKTYWDNDKPSAEYFVQLNRVSKEQIVWGGNYMTDNLFPSPCWIMWDKGFSEEVTFATFEMAWTSFKSSAKKFDKSPYQNNKIHPTQKPVALYEWLFKNYAKEGDKILDTHLGSGSIAIALHRINQIEKMDLTLTACELDEQYYNDAVKRIKQQIAQQTIFT